MAQSSGRAASHPEGIQVISELSSKRIEQTNGAVAVMEAPFAAHPQVLNEPTPR